MRNKTTPEVSTLAAGLLRWPLLFILVLWGGRAWGANCGGETPCACGDTITSDYTMAGNLTCTNAGAALTIGADNIDLNMDGYSITGDGANMTRGIYSTGRDNVTINGPGTIQTTLGHGIAIYGGNGTTITNITINDVNDDDGGFGGTDGIYVGYVDEAPQNVKIAGCTIGSVADSIPRNGIAFVSGTGIEISNNMIYGGKIGIDIEPYNLMTVTNVTISGNAIDTLANTLAGDLGGTKQHKGIAIVIATVGEGDVTGTVLVSNNTIDLNGEEYDSDADGLYVQNIDQGTITFDGNTVIGVEDAIVVSNFDGTALTFTRNSLTGDSTIKRYGVLFADAAQASAGIDITNNVFDDFIYGIHFHQDNGTEADIYNNTFDLVGGNSGFGIKVENASDNADIKNNIFYEIATGNHYYIWEANTDATIACDYNAYHATNNGSNKFFVITATEKTWLEWQGAGYDTNGAEDSDPLFNSATDFHLQSSSPCIGAGTPISGIYVDYDGWFRRYPESIGAYANHGSLAAYNRNFFRARNPSIGGVQQGSLITTE